MRLKDILDEVIIKEVYKKVKVESELAYSPSEMPDEVVERIQTDRVFKKRYLKQLGTQFRKLGYRDLQIVDIDPASHTLLISYTGYYTGCRKYPEIHLKTLLILHDVMGRDVRDPAVFDGIVEKARRDLGKKNIKGKEERLYRFAALFKRAIAEKLV